MQGDSIPHRERICLGCRDKSCCSYYTVTLTGSDLMRIAATLQLSPMEFVSCHTVAEDEIGFLLDPDGPGHVLTLLKRPLSGESPPPCLFLIRTNDGHGLCALAAEVKPAQCRTFPSYLSQDAVALAHRPAGCVRSWSYGDLELEVERSRLTDALAEQVRYGHLVEEWNDRVRRDGRGRSCDEFCTFIVNSYRVEEGGA